MPNRTTDIAVIGPGAIGGTVAAWLTRTAGNAVTVCARTPFDQLKIDAPGEVLIAHPQLVVELSRSAVFRGDAPYHQHQSVAGHHLRMADAGRAQHLGARPFGEFQVVGVIDHPTRIGILEIDAHAIDMWWLGAALPLAENR